MCIIGSRLEHLPQTYEKWARRAAQHTKLKRFIRKYMEPKKFSSGKKQGVKQENQKRRSKIANNPKGERCIFCTPPLSGIKVRDRGIEVDAEFDTRTDVTVLSSEE